MNTDEAIEALQVLIREHAELKAELSTVKAENAEQYRSMFDALAEANQENAELKRENAELKEECEKLGDIVGGLRSQIGELKTEHTERGGDFIRALAVWAANGQADDWKNVKRTASAVPWVGDALRLEEEKRTRPNMTNAEVEGAHDLLEAIDCTTSDMKIGAPWSAWELLKLRLEHHKPREGYDDAYRREVGEVEEMLAERNVLRDEVSRNCLEIAVLRRDRRQLEDNVLQGELDQWDDWRCLDHDEPEDRASLVRQAFDALSKLDRIEDER